MSLAPCAPRLRPIGLLALLASVVLTAVPTHAQNYKADPVEQGLRSKGQLAKKYAKNGVGDRQLFEDYLTKYFFPAMTQPTPNGLAGLAKANNDLFSAFLDDAKTDVQAYVHKQALAFTVRVLRGRYHPAVRNNALLILGKLQDDYATGAPSARANELLCALATRGATNPKAPPYELSGALIGLDRHTRAFKLLAGSAKSKTAKALYTIISTETLPMHVGPGVNDWIYLKTAKAIGNLGMPGPKGGVFASAIAKKATDENLSLETRAAIAAQLDRMNLAPGKVKAEVVTGAVFDLANAIGDSESEIATKFEDLQLRGGRRMAVSARGNEARRFRESDKNPGEMVLVREGILDLLIDLRSAVRAGAAVADENAKPRLAAIDEAVTDAIQAASNKDLIDLNVADAVKSMASVIDDNQPPAPAEEEEEAEEGVLEATVQAAVPVDTK
ncbi:hypothetical protein MalM25_02190 [Planctomycetes bacterium MalM25]|nr:hypothetical protein MalM25_02190 [Planctomycetes bacterium MalM25]